MKTNVFSIFLITFTFFLYGQETQKQRLEQIINKEYDTSINDFSIVGYNNFYYDNTELTQNIESNYTTFDSATNTQETTEKTTYTYYSNGKIKTKTTYNYNNGSLDPVAKTLYNYNSDNQLIEKISQYHDNSNAQYVNSLKESYIYATNTDILPNEIEIFSWNPSTNSWSLGLKNLVTYNSSWQYTELIFQRSNGSDYLKYNRTYDTNNKLIEEVSFYKSGNDWKNFKKNSYTYTENSNKLTYEIINNEWDGSKWEKQAKIFRIKDKNIQNLLLDEYYEWDVNNSQWIGKNKTTYEYSTNTVTQEKIDWDKNNNTWFSEGTIKNVYTYDDNSNNRELIMPTEISGKEPQITSQIINDFTPGFNPYYQKLNEITSYSRADINTTTWDKSKKLEFVYNQVTSINKLSEIKGNVHPNPFNNYIVFEINNTKYYNLNITNIKGQVIYNKQHKNGDKILINNIPSGVYFYKIITKKGIKQGKIIKIK